MEGPAQHSRLAGRPGEPAMTTQRRACLRRCHSHRPLPRLTSHPLVRLPAELADLYPHDAEPAGQKSNEYSAIRRRNGCRTSHAPGLQPEREIRRSGRLMVSSRSPADALRTGRYAVLTQGVRRVMYEHPCRYIGTIPECMGRLPGECPAGLAGEGPEGTRRWPDGAGSQGFLTRPPVDLGDRRLIQMIRLLPGHLGSVCNRGEPCHSLTPLL
jgi:hypothetical protein